MTTDPYQGRYEILNTAYEQLRDVRDTIERNSLVLIALIVREKFPNAAEVGVESSDQGPYMGWITSVDGVEDEDEDWQDDLSSLLSNLDCAQGASYCWEYFCKEGRLPRSGYGTLLLDPIIEFDGDGAAYARSKQ